MRNNTIFLNHGADWLSNLQQGGFCGCQSGRDSRSIKQKTIEEIDKVLKKRKKFYVSSDFPFVQLIGFYLTYKAKIMNQYLIEKGYTMVQAKDVDLNTLTKQSDVKVRANRNIWIKTENYINYKK
ncbi:MAG: hypothetical protein WC428_02140 [Candidatus Paceibacterota bacterium]